MDTGLVSVQFVHIAGGAAWLGGSTFANLVVLPFIARQPVDRQRGLFAAIVLGPERVMIGAALLAGLSGLLRGTLFGPIKSLAALGRPYGLLWFAAILITAVVFAVGGRVTSPAARQCATTMHCGAQMIRLRRSPGRRRWPAFAWVSGLSCSASYSSSR